LNKCLNNGARLAGKKDCTTLGGLERNKHILKNIEHISMTGMGSSYNSALFSAIIWKKLKAFNTINVIETSEFCEYDLALK